MDKKYTAGVYMREAAARSKRLKELGGTVTVAAGGSGGASGATKLATKRAIWGQGFDGTADVSGDLTLGTSKIKVTDAIYLEWDEDNTAWHLVGAGFYADTFVSAGGVSSSSGSSSSSGGIVTYVYSSAQSSPDAAGVYNAAYINARLAAVSLRLDDLEGGSSVAVVNSAPALSWGSTSTVGTVNGTALTVTMPSNPNTDTKNTAGSTDSSSKLYLIGATSQAANPQTYSHDTAYVGTDGCLYSGGSKVVTSQYTTHLYVGASGAASNAATSNGATYLKLYDDGTSRASFLIKGSGATTVSSDSSGNITVSSTDTNTDTKNTAGSTDSSSKLYLIGATSQAANPQTYSHDTAYVGTDGCLYSGGSKVVTSSNYTSVVTKLGTSTVGGTAKPVYLNAGVATALSATVGSSSTPVYLNAGTLTACSYSLNGYKFSYNTTTRLLTLMSGSTTVCQKYLGYVFLGAAGTTSKGTSAGNSASSASVVIYTDSVTGWSASSSASWLTVSASSGTSGGTLKLTWTANTSSSRTGTVTVYGKDSTTYTKATWTVTQGGTSSSVNLYYSWTGTTSATVLMCLCKTASGTASGYVLLYSGVTKDTTMTATKTAATWKGYIGTYNYLCAVNASTMAILGSVSCYNALNQMGLYNNNQTLKVTVGTYA